jgi:Cdc6-like AAA superfamily ATPase
MLTETVEIMSSWKAPWLLVFDNYDDHQAFPTLTDFIPQTKFGFFLITSRHSESELARIGTVITLEKMSEHESLTLLSLSSGIPISTEDSNEAKDARAVVERLGYLALAIDQSGAYIRRRRLKFSEFIPEFEDHKQTVMTRIPALWDYRKDQQALSIYTTWDLSWELVRDDVLSKATKSHLMAICAYINFHDISESLFIIPLSPTEEFIRHSKRAEYNDLIEPFMSDCMSPLVGPEGAWNLFLLRNVLEEMASLSLAQDISRSRKSTQEPSYNNSSSTLRQSVPQSLRRFSLHPLVSDWIKLRMDAQFQCFHLALRIIASCIWQLIESATGTSVMPDNYIELMSHLAALEDSARLLISSADTRALLSCACDLIEHLRNSLVTLRSDKLFQKRQNISAWLSPLDFRAQQTLFLGYHAPGTCSWILKEALFSTWLQDSGTVLYVYGDPGTGKTVMASFIADHLEKTYQQERDNTIVIYACLDFQTANESNLVDYIGALLKQVYWPVRDIDGEEIDDIAELYEEYMTRRSGPTYEELEHLLKKMLEKFTRQFIIIDGLDEISETQQSNLLRSIARLGDTVNVLIFSRPTQFGAKLVEENQDPARIVLTMDMTAPTRIQTDIELFVREELKKISLQTILPSKLDEIANTIIQKSNSSYVLSSHRLISASLADELIV